MHTPTGYRVIDCPKYVRDVEDDAVDAKPDVRRDDTDYLDLAYAQLAGEGRHRILDDENQSILGAAGNLLNLPAT